jgi:acyl carrier protein
MCSASLGVGSEDLLGEDHCPRCFAELYFIVAGSVPYFFTRRLEKPERGREQSAIGARLSKIVEEQMGIEGITSAADLAELNADSLDTIELVMEFEDELRNLNFDAMSDWDLDDVRIWIKSLHSARKVKNVKHVESQR